MPKSEIILFVVLILGCIVAVLLADHQNRKSDKNG